MYKLLQYVNGESCQMSSVHLLYSIWWC